MDSGHRVTNGDPTLYCERSDDQDRRVRARLGRHPPCPTEPVTEDVGVREPTPQDVVRRAQREQHHVRQGQAEQVVISGRLHVTIPCDDEACAAIAEHAGDEY